MNPIGLSVVISVLLHVLACPVSAQTAPGAPDTVVVNLQEAVTRALEISPEVRAVDSGRTYAEARLRFARAHRYLAEFEATSAHSTSPGLLNPNNTPTGELYLDPDVRNDWEDLSIFNRVDIELVQPLFTWGELSGNIRAARFGVEVEVESVRAKELEVAARTAELYYNLLLTEELYRLTEEAGDIVDRAIEEIDRLIEEGDEGVDDADLFQVQITQQEFFKRVVEVEEKRHTVRAALSRQLFLPDGTVAVAATVILTPVPFELQSMEYYQEIALDNRSELSQARAGLEARNALVSVARSDFFPKLFLGVSANYSFAPGRYRQWNPYVGDPFLSNSVRAGIGFRQKLNFAQTRAKVEEARSEASQVLFLGEAARQLVLFEVEEAYRNVLISRAALDTQAEALRISKDWLRLEEINFDLEVGDTENLVKAVRANLELQATRHQGVHDYNISVLRLLKSTGTLAVNLINGTFVD